MRNVVLLSLLSGLLATSCLTIQGVKKPLILVDAPKNTTVAFNDEIVEIEDVTAFREETSQGNSKNVTLYKYPGVKIKLRKNTTLDLIAGHKKGITTIKTKPAVGLLIVEGIFTLGVGTIVDLASGAYRVPKNRYVDVPAVLENKTPRDEKDLKKKVRSDFETKS